ncbi:MAG: sigma-54-dependent Fis family transcriptional regulator [Gammaproteobacteria bacterium RBG_16_57_12]|nr:MAG: sigma-54-dependent Fis family transcriptional regulator [Gammaproteobacteria bacterium RBG_16_57_12]
MGISLSYLDMLLDNLEEGVLLLDKDRKVLSINQSATSMLGQESESIVSSLCPSIFRGSACARECESRGYCSLMQPKAQANKVQSIAIKRPDGSLLSLRMWAMSFPPEEEARCAVILRDCTREKELEDEASERLRLGGLIGRSNVMRELFQHILRAAASEATVLISGESGTGKELVARALHENSSRANGPYIRVHCAALAETLLESELFGHARGAFTGATSARAGRFEAADGGTLLLDEIGEISPSIQVKLLRVLQEREVERLGENQPRKVDVRILAATHKDLSAMVEAGEFRADLYYRLRVLPLRTPALRERREDISLLASQQLGNLSARYNRGEVKLAWNTLELLESYDWPGNVRELVNALEYALVHSEGSTILPHHLPPEIQDIAARQMSTGKEGATPQAIPIRFTNYYQAPPAATDEKAAIENALRQTGGNKAAAAKALGMSRTTLWKRLKEYGLLAGEDTA